MAPRTCHKTQGSYTNCYTDLGTRQMLMTINRISVGKMAHMFSFYFNYNINVLANSTVYFMVFGQ